MRAHRGDIRAWLISPFFLLLLGVSSASAQGTTRKPPDLGTQGTTPPQQRVGSAIDNVCPGLFKILPSLNAAQSDLFRRCSDMEDPGTTGLGTSALPGVLNTLWPDGGSVQGANAVDTKSMQLQSIGTRLAALRLGIGGISLNGLPVDSDMRTAAADPSQGGGGASADRAPFGGLGVFLNGIGNFGSQDTTSRETGFDYHTAGLIAGTDYRFTDKLIAGLAFSYLRTNADLDLSLGEVDSQSYGLFLYGTYYFGQAYIDLLGGFTWNNYDVTRRIVYGPAPGFTGEAVNRTASGSTDGWQYTFNGGAGYDFQQGPLTVTPYVRVEYLNLNIAGYTESGADGLNLKVQSQTVDSLLTILGGRAGYAISTSVGVFVPQFRAEWRHELLNDKRAVHAQFANDPFGVPFLVSTDNPDRNYFSLGASLVGTFQKGVSAFADFATILGLTDVANYNFTAGVRVQF